jgi:hypothetical protein
LKTLHTRNNMNWPSSQSNKLKVQHSWSVACSPLIISLYRRQRAGLCWKTNSRKTC